LRTAGLPVVSFLTGWRPVDRRLAAIWQVVYSRLRDKRFWQVQALVAVATGAHYGIEIAGYTGAEDTLHGLAITLYIVPLVYAALNFGWEGAVMTSLWGIVLTSPSTWIWHHAALHWLAEVGQLGTTMTVGLLVAWRVDRESNQRKIAEDLAARIGLLNQQLTNAQEEEWRRIARELHDETAQSLILLCQRLDRAAAAPRLPRRAREDLASIRSVAQGILGGVRRFSRDLRPSALDDLGLVAAIQWLLGEMSGEQEIETNVELMAPMPRLAQDTELGLFRIVQEALRNVKKHADASKVTVRLSHESGSLRISVEDNGRGFSPPPVLSDLVLKGKLGLVGMQERAQLVGGTLEIRSGLGGGTCLTVSMAC
jgi:two-component system sensor histidine kinase DegS